MRAGSEGVDALRPLPLDRFAEMSARIEAGVSRDRVLAEAEVAEAVWDLTQETWLGRIGAQAAQGNLALQRRYAEIFAIHRKRAEVALRAARRSRAAPAPVPPVARVASLVLAPPGEQGKEAEGIGPAAPPPREVSTAEISDTGQKALARRPSTPFTPSTTAPPVSAIAAASSSPPAKRPPSAAEIGSGTADISTVVHAVLARQASTPFTPSTKDPPVSEVHEAAPSPAKGAQSAAEIGSGTVDISTAVQAVLARRASTPFTPSTKDPSVSATPEVAPSPAKGAQSAAEISSGTAEISAAVQEVLARKPITPFTPSTAATTPKPVPARAPEESAKEAPRAPEVGSGTAEISAAVQEVLARKPITPFAGPAAGAAAPVPAAARPPGPAKPVAPSAPAVGGETSEISAVVQQVLAARKATPFAGGARSGESSASGDRGRDPVAPGPPAPTPPAVAPSAPAPPAVAPSAPTPAVVARAAPSPLAPPPGAAPRPPDLSLEQYAELWIELSLAPSQSAQILARWGVRDAPSWAALQAVWQERIGADPALARRWAAVVAARRAARGIR